MPRKMTPPPAEWVQRYNAAYTSEDAWSAFVDALEPGPEMDFNVECCILKPDGAARSYPKIPLYSTGWGLALTMAVEENDSLLITKHEDVNGRHFEFVCEVEADDYRGEASEKRLPVAVCRAFLHMFHPND